jgi:hypothetical protein
MVHGQDQTDPSRSNPARSERCLGRVTYAGAPIVDPDGFALGTIACNRCAARQFSVAQRDALVDL